jgi:hypothetical protein
MAKISSPRIANTASGVQERSPWLEENNTSRKTGDFQRKSRIERYPVLKGPPYTIQRVRNVGSIITKTTQENKRYRAKSVRALDATERPDRKISKYWGAASTTRTLTIIRFG